MIDVDKYFRAHADELVKLTRNAFVTLIKDGGHYKDPVVYDENEPKITVGKCVDIFPCEIETKTLKGSGFLPGFSIVVYKYWHGNRWTPPEYEDVAVAETRHIANAAAIAIETYWKIFAKGYWDSNADEEYAKEVREWG